MSHPLLSLAATFSELGLLAVGGVNSVVPEMQRRVVGIEHWMSPREFAALFALAQAAPGPNLLVVTLVGWRVAGVPGALVSTCSTIAPTSLVTFLLSRVWHRQQAGGWRDTIQRGLTPVTVGLVLAAAVLLGRAAVQDVGGLAVLCASALLTLRGGIHPLWLLAAGAAVGALGVVG